jgi:hypothetical protein
VLANEFANEDSIMLDTSGLPHKTASLDQAGLDKLLDWARQDPSRPPRLAELLEQDPVALMDHLFRLTAPVRRAVGITGPDALRERLRPVIAALASGNAGPMTIEMPPIDEAPELTGTVQPAHCGCLVSPTPGGRAEPPPS